MAWKTLDDMDLAGKVVLVRVDINVPVEHGQVTDASFQRPLLITESRNSVYSDDLEIYPNPVQHVLYWNENIPLKNIKLLFLNNLFA